MKQVWQNRWLGMVMALALTACPTPLNALARLEINPNAVLLTLTGEEQILVARALDTSGNPTKANLTWTSSRPEVVSVDINGRIKAVAAIGSSLVTVSSGNIKSAPIAVLVAPTVSGAVLVDDTQIVSEPSNETPNQGLEVGSHFHVTLEGIAPPAPNTILVGRGGKGLAGKVISASPQGNQVQVKLEMVPITEVFTQLKFEETMPSNALEPRTTLGSDVKIKRDGEGWNSSLTTEGISPLFKSKQLSRLNDPPVGEVKFDLAGFKCKGKMAGAFSTIAKLELQQQLSFPIAIETQGLKLKYLRLLAKGSIVASGELGLKLDLGFEGEVKCKRELGAIPIPVGGALSFLVQPVVPYGIGFKLKGKALIPLVGVGIQGKLGAEVKLGFEYSAVSGFKNLSDFTVIREFKPKGNVPLQKGPRIELGADFFAYGNLSVAAFNSGWSWLDGIIQQRSDILEGTFGPRAELNLAIPADQAADTSYASEYNLKLRAALGLDGDLKKFFQAFENTVKIADPQFTSDIYISRSAQTPDFAASPSQVKAGQTVRLSLNLADTYFPFPPLAFYNVNSVNIYKLKQDRLLPVLIPFRTLYATDGQASFSADWTTTTDDIGEHEFVAFVNTSFLPAFPLEVNKNSIRKVMVTSADPDLTAKPGPYTVTPIGTYSGGQVHLDSSGQAAAGMRFETPRSAQIWRNNALEQIGNYPNSTVSVATAINNSGQVIGHASGNDLPTALGFLWQDGQWSDLSKFESQSGQKISGATMPRVINDAGMIAGRTSWYSEICKDYRDSVATLWSNGLVRKLGMITEPPTPCHAFSSDAFGINQLGHVVGVSYSDQSEFEAFVWRDGVMQGLGFLAGGKFSQAFDISETGLVVGKSTSSQSSFYRAALWKDGSVLDLHPVAATSSEAIAVNSLGQVLVNASNAGSSNAFVWQDGKLYPILDLLPANQNLGAIGLLDINDQGQILGFSKTNLFLLTPVK